MTSQGQGEVSSSKLLLVVTLHEHYSYIYSYCTHLYGDNFGAEQLTNMGSVDGRRSPLKVNCRSPTGRDAVILMLIEKVSTASANTAIQFK